MSAMFQRDTKLFFRCLTSALLLSLILGSVCALAAGAVIYRSGQVYTKAKVAVIDQEDSVFSRILIGMAAGTDALSDLIETQVMKEDEAMEALRGGNCVAVVLLPAGFVGDMLSGTAGEGVIYLSDGAATQATVVESVARFGEQLLLAGQAGVFAGESLLRDTEDDVALDAALDRSNGALVEEAMNASERYFHTEIVETGMSATAYYGMCWLTLLLFMVSLFFVPLLTADTHPALLRRLDALGVGLPRFMGWKLLWLTLFRLLVALGVLLTFGGRFGLTGGHPFGGVTVLSLVVSACFITLAGTAVTFALGDGVTANVILGMGGLFLVGGLVPARVLPSWVVTVGTLTPFGTALELMKPAFGEGCSLVGGLLAVVYSVVAVALVGWKRNRMVRGDH